MKKILLTIMTAIVLTSCYKLDTKTYRSKSYNERVRFIIIHYTGGSRKSSINALVNGGVSSHYLVTDDKSDPVYELVPTEKRAWHAGISSFAGRTNLNDSSVGIEVVNMGYSKIDPNLESEDPLENIKNRVYAPFTDDQIKKLAILIGNLVKEYNIRPINILGHSDIAPDRKQDPGPMFPWKKLYDDYNLGVWYDQDDFAKYNDIKLFNSFSISAIQSEFKRYGYGINITGDYDNQTIEVISAFQSRFRPSKVTGIMDLETFAIIRALNAKYR